MGGVGCVKRLAGRPSAVGSGSPSILQGAEVGGRVAKLLAIGAGSELRRDRSKHAWQQRAPREGYGSLTKIIRPNKGRTPQSEWKKALERFCSSPNLACQMDA